ncbi:hypothetical protein OQA88_1622 [Cercophora sp. LCS_1]
MIRPRLRIPRAPRFGLQRTQSSPSPFLQIAHPQRASVHTLPPSITYPFRDASPESQPLLTPIGFDIAWTQYQTMMIHKLNQMTVGGEWEHQDLKKTLLETAREPEHASLFNHASMAHNNQFFFEQLASGPVEMPEALKEGLEHSFGSIDTLRRTMIDSALAMFGPGYVWLVQDNSQNLYPTFKVLVTYLAGSPYPGAHWRRQEVDLNTAVGSSEKGREAAKRHLDNVAYGQGKKTAAETGKSFAPGGINVVPILCLNVWQHVYMPDYGVDGKEAFVERWWNFVDWDKVAQKAVMTKNRPQLKT